MSIKYDTMPVGPRRDRVSSTPNSLLHRIAKPPLADRLSQDDSSIKSNTSTYVYLFYFLSPPLSNSLSAGEMEDLGLSGRNEGEEAVPRRPPRNLKQPKIWTRSWTCLWEMARRKKPTHPRLRLRLLPRQHQHLQPRTSIWRSVPALKRGSRVQTLTSFAYQSSSIFATTL